MAHALKNYDGPCKNIHGHSYLLRVTVIGTPVNDPENSKNGMVVDFGDLKNWVNESVVKKFDHALLLSRDNNIQNLQVNSQLFANLMLLDFQPTCENLLVYIAKVIRNKLPDSLQLHSLMLRETSNSYAEWYAEDNK